VTHWLGLNLGDIALNILVLALLPGLFAAYGGHLAAEAISDKKRQFKIKAVFWLMFVIFVLATGWQQFGVAESDLARDTKETWADTVVLRCLAPSPTPPPFWYVPKTSHAAAVLPDVILKLIYPQEFAVMIYDNSSVVLNNPRWWFAIWDLDQPGPNGTPKILPIPTDGADWIRPHENIGPMAALGKVASGTKDGDRLLGFIGVTCPKCIRTRLYWVYAVKGDTEIGWYSEVKGASIDLPALDKAMPEIQKDTQKFFAGIPERDRIHILKTFRDVH
jgi:hypothetical protein